MTWINAGLALSPDARQTHQETGASYCGQTGNSRTPTAFAYIALGGESEMLKDYVPPTRAEECRNTAEILRELAAQLQFYDTRELLISLADDLDCRATQFERQGQIVRFERQAARSSAATSGGKVGDGRPGDPDVRAIREETR